MTNWFTAVGQALHPLDVPPELPRWNHASLRGITDDVPRAEAAVLMAIRDSPEPGVVFTLRCDDLAHHAGQVSFPGGRAEPDDASVVATALREGREEIALDAGAVEPLGYLDRIETTSGFRVTPVVAKLAADAVLSPQPDEVARIFEVPLDFLLDPGNLRQFDIELRGARRKVYEYTGVAPRIWGATASMLVNLLQRMGRMP